MLRRLREDVYVTILRHGRSRAVAQLLMFMLERIHRDQFVFKNLIISYCSYEQTPAIVLNIPDTDCV